MANVQIENGFLKIACELAEALTQINLSAYQWRIAWVIFRKTYGWRKKSAQIARSVFVKMTDLDGRHVTRALRQLESMNVITVTREEKGAYVYAFQKNYELWKLPNGPKEWRVPKREKKYACPGSDSGTDTGTEKCADTGTVNRKKENEKNKKCSYAHLLNLSQERIAQLFKDVASQFINKVGSRTREGVPEERAKSAYDEIMAIRKEYGLFPVIIGMQAALGKSGYDFAAKQPANYVRIVAKKANEEYHRNNPKPEDSEDTGGENAPE